MQNTLTLILILVRLGLVAMMVLFMATNLNADTKFEELKGQYHQQVELVEKIEKEIARVEISILEVSQKRDQLQLQLDDNSQRMNQLRLNLNEHKALLRKELIALQKMNYESQLKRLLNPDRYTQRVRVRSYYAELRRQHINTLGVIQLAINEIEFGKREENLLVNQLDRQKRDLSQQYQRLLEKKATRHAEVDNLQNLLKDERSRLAAEKAAALELAQKTEQAARRKAQFNPFSHLTFEELRGKLSWPTEGEFKPAAKPFKKAWQVIHSQSEEIRTIAQGKVTFSEWLPQLGLVIIIDHGNGYQSIYGNNAYSLVQRGDQVGYRQMIAKTGKTGGKDQLGLFFQLRKDTTAIDFQSWLEKKKV